MTSFRLLSIDGGGIRGLLPALILAELERRANRPLNQLFDVIAGTSTGGILALGLSIAEQPNATELVRLYETDGPRIFPRTAVDKIVGHVRKLPVLDKVWAALDLPPDVDPRDAFDPKYDGVGRHDALAAFFGKHTLQNARVRVFVTSYDTDARKPVFFVRDPRDILLPDSADDRAGGLANEYFYDALGGPNTSMVDAAMATSAAPTYFPPHPIERAGGLRPHCLVDGGIFSNNPTGLAHAFMRVGRDYEQDTVLSLGTGAMERSYTYAQTRGWGAAQWGLPALKMMLDGQTEAVALLMQKRLPATQYFRMQGLLGKGNAVSDDLDDVSPENIAQLKALAAQLIREHDKNLDELCAQLVR